MEPREPIDRIDPCDHRDQRLEDDMPAQLPRLPRRERLSAGLPAPRSSIGLRTSLAGPARAEPGPRAARRAWAAAPADQPGRAVPAGPARATSDTAATLPDRHAERRRRVAE